MLPKRTANMALELKWERETTREMRHGQLESNIRFYLPNHSFILQNHSPLPVEKHAISINNFDIAHLVNIIDLVRYVFK